MRDKSEVSCIVNADDFGRNANVNAAILHCFRNGWISSATIMPTMPGFDQACEIANRFDLCDRIGIHFVLTEGSPLTCGIAKCRRFCNVQGTFHVSRKKRILYLSITEKDAVNAELRAQIKHCQERGLKLSHFSSHHHIHEERGIAQLLIPLLKEFNIPYTTIMHNMPGHRSIVRRIYTKFYNAYLRFHGVNRSDYLVSFDQYISLKHKSCTRIAGKTIEIMTHPILDSDNIVVDATVNRAFECLVAEAGIKDAGIR